jgi:hypothetical protein
MSFDPGAEGASAPAPGVVVGGDVEGVVEPGDVAAGAAVLAGEWWLGTSRLPINPAAKAATTSMATRLRPRGGHSDRFGAPAGPSGAPGSALVVRGGGAFQSGGGGVAAVGGSKVGDGAVATGAAGRPSAPPSAPVPSGNAWGVHPSPSQKRCWPEFHGSGYQPAAMEGSLVRRSEIDLNEG